MQENDFKCLVCDASHKSKYSLKCHEAVHQDNKVEDISVLTYYAFVSLSFERGFYSHCQHFRDKFFVYNAMLMLVIRLFIVELCSLELRLHNVWVGA